MRCPYCAAAETRLLDQHPDEPHAQEAECTGCGKRFTTYEKIDARITQIRKRDGRIADFNQDKITTAIWKAAQAVGGTDRQLAKRLADQVVEELNRKFHPHSIPSVEEIQDVVEKVLIESGHARTAKAYILYRAKRTELRESISRRAMPDADKAAFLDMFSHNSKLAALVEYDTIDAYRELLFYLKNRQHTGALPTHPNYLNDNELARTIYQNKYYLKDLKGRAIETRPEDVFARLAAFLAAVEAGRDQQQRWADAFYGLLVDGLFLPGGRVIAGAGDLYRLKTLANCFVSLIEADNLEAIYKTAYECARTYSYGGGIGVDISSLRPQGSVVHNAADNSTGSVSFMELYSLTTGLIGQSGRRGALMLTIDIKHPDSPLFVAIKKTPSWVTNQIVEQCRWSGRFTEEQLAEVERQVRENIQVRFANISLKVTNEFMQAVREQRDFGPEKILVYRKDTNVASLGVPQGSGMHYSFGIPSKPIDRYQLLHAVDSPEQLLPVLAEQGAGNTAIDLDDADLRDAFGDIVLSLPGKGYDLAIRRAGDFMLYFNAPETGEIRRLIKARSLWDSFIESNYLTAEPGLIFWSTMSRYSPSNYVGRPVASTNPCIVGSSLVSTDRGLERMDQAIEREQVHVLTDNRVPLEIRESSGMMYLQQQQSGMSFDLAGRIWKSGVRETLKLTTQNGYELIATPDHKIMTRNGWKELRHLDPAQDEILIQGGAGRFTSDKRLPFDAQNEFVGKNGRRYSFNFPSSWSAELGELLGWLVGDGCVTPDPDNRVCLVFGKGDESILQKMKTYVEHIYGKPTRTSVRDSTSQLRYHSRYFADYLRKLGVRSVKAEKKTVPESLFVAPEEAVIGFLRGLFTADGTMSVTEKKGKYIRLTSKSQQLLKDVQLLLLNLGMRSCIYARHRAARKPFTYTTADGSVKSYVTDGRLWELQVSKGSAHRFLEDIGFLCSKHREKRDAFLAQGHYSEDFFDTIRCIEPHGVEEVFDLTEPRTHSFIANGMVISNCGEVPLEDGGACNLGSLNLSRFVRDGYTGHAALDWNRLREATAVAIRFLDNVVTWNESLNPLEKQRRAARETRRLGLGVMGIADMLNQLGIAYDSEEGIALMEQVMKTIADQAYAASARLAKEKGPSPLFSYDQYRQCPFFQECLSDDTRELIRKNGLRNIALLSIAPTGTISNVVLGYEHAGTHFIGVSGGIEPIFALYYTRRSETLDREKRNVFFRVFHATVHGYLEMKGLAEKGQQATSLDDLRTVLPPHFFRTAHVIDHENRIKIQGICQKYVDHSISSTVNLPEEIEPEAISEIYLTAWESSLKGVTIYRDGSRYPILSVEGQETDFQRFKKKTFTAEIPDMPATLTGGTVIRLNSILTTPYHALRRGLVAEQNGVLRLADQRPSLPVSVGTSPIASGNALLSQCPKCSNNTLKIENGCKSCIDGECGYALCDT